jgi:hypothetical protein
MGSPSLRIKKIYMQRDKRPANGSRPLCLPYEGTGRAVSISYARLCILGATDAACLRRLWDDGMTLLQLHQDDPGGLAGEGRCSMPARVFARISAACRLMHRAIVDAKIRRLQNELTFEDGYRKQPSCADDAARYPQRPLILGDKWDF